MTNQREAALADFKRIMKWIGIAAVLMVVAALIYLALSNAFTASTALATIFGVFFSVVLGCGLFAAAFFSDKSGLDQQVTDATRPERGRARAAISNRRKPS